MLEKLDRFNRTVSGWAASIGYAALVFMVLLTCADVLGTKLFLLPVPGSLDMIMLAQLIAITFAAAMTLRQDRHVSVEFFVVLFPRRVQAVLDCVVQLLGLILFVVIAWRLFDHGNYLQAVGEQTPTARIGMAPYTYAAALAIVPVCLVLLQQFLSALLKATRNEP
jgi:TRAP-type C4-dicarboxylate transport system permease small subunit